MLSIYVSRNFSQQIRRILKNHRNPKNNFFKGKFTNNVNLQNFKEQSSKRKFGIQLCLIFCVGPQKGKLGFAHGEG